MDFLATGAIVHPDKIEPLMAEESRVLNELRAEGIVTAAFRRVSGSGVVSFVRGDSLDEVDAFKGPARR